MSKLSDKTDVSITELSEAVTCKQNENGPRKQFQGNEVTSEGSQPSHEENQ